MAVHTTIFERLIALTRERANMGFLIYLADSIGYLGYVGVMLGHGLFPAGEQFLGFFTTIAAVLLVAALISVVAAMGVYARHAPAAGPRTG